MTWFYGICVYPEPLYFPQSRLLWALEDNSLWLLVSLASHGSKQNWHLPEFVPLRVCRWEGEMIRHMNRFLVFLGHLFSTLHSPCHHPAILFSWLTRTICQGRAQQEVTCQLHRDRPREGSISDRANHYRHATLVHNSLTIRRLLGKIPSLFINSMWNSLWVSKQSSE